MKLKVKFLSGLSVILVAVAISSCSKDSESEPYQVYNTYINLAGEDNMRDMGGFAGADGKRVLYRKLFRSGELSSLTASDVDSIKNLGIQQVIDLRTEEEIASLPDTLPANVTTYHLPLIASTGGSSSSSYMSYILSGQMKAEDMMLSTYTTIDSLKIANWTQLFNLLETGTTTLWHCTAGKDRAGMTAALVLYSLGVDTATIKTDFLASNTYLSAYIESTIAYMDAQYGAGTGELMRPLLGVEEVYIVSFFKTIKSTYGSLDNFLDTLGVDKAKMRSLFLEK